MLTIEGLTPSRPLSIASKRRHRQRPQRPPWTTSGRTERGSAHARRRRAKRKRSPRRASQSGLRPHGGAGAGRDARTHFSLEPHSNPRSMGGFRLRVTLETAGSNCMSNGKVSGAATLLLSLSRCLRGAQRQRERARCSSLGRAGVWKPSTRLLPCPLAPRRSLRRCAPPPRRPGAVSIWSAWLSRGSRRG